ncbi:hypothetical protein HHK36_030479 [Tetracentron sinense]|uniref:EF-hand domain-containing protein n=1 Tax=Tetracentron sinense TaxID=13715 RepID=A0A834Y7R3_TETSI|nr:hypothetical protein HHK36_030479 [Tetracentron sinense]
MGHGISKSIHPDSSDASNGSKPSRSDRLRRRFHRHHGSSGSSSHSQLKPLTAENFVGIALIKLIGAEMKFKDKWIACISLGERAFRTATSDQTDKPVWNSTNRLSKNNLIGYCEIDLFEMLTQDSGSDFVVLDLLDPSSSNTVVGNISLSFSVEDPSDTEKSFARRILSIVDYNEDGKLSFSEFCDLINAFGNKVADGKKEELFGAADKNGDGSVSMDELATLLAIQQEKEPLINSCPVCGEILDVSDKLNAMIHLTLCFDEGTGNQVMTGGFLTDKQASYG